MKIIVMGCGRVGSTVSRLFAKIGHDVTVIDHQDPDAHAKLGADFKGKVLHGIGFDRDILLEAGIENAEAFVAASNSDNANIVAARTARNIFRVPRVIARLYDPLRAEVYQRLRLMTISTTTWGAERIVAARFNGHKVTQKNIPGEVMAIAITRSAHTFIPVSGTEFQEGDTAYLTAIPSAMHRLEVLLGE